MSKNDNIKYLFENALQCSYFGYLNDLVGELIEACKCEEEVKGKYFSRDCFVRLCGVKGQDGRPTRTARGQRRRPEQDVSVQARSPRRERSWYDRFSLTLVVLFV